MPVVERARSTSPYWKVYRLRCVQCDRSPVLGLGFRLGHRVLRIWWDTCPNAEAE